MAFSALRSLYGSLAEPTVTSGSDSAPQRSMDERGVISGSSVPMQAGNNGQPQVNIPAYTQSWSGIDPNVQDRPSLIPIRQNGEWIAPEWLKGAADAGSSLYLGSKGYPVGKSDAMALAGNFTGGGFLGGQALGPTAEAGSTVLSMSGAGGRMAAGENLAANGGMNTGQYMGQRGAIYVPDATDPKLMDMINKYQPVRGQQVAERVPSYKGFTGDGTDTNATIGVDVIRQTPTTMAKQAETMSQYTNYPDSAAKDAESVFQTMGDQTKGNLLYLHDQMPADIRQQSKAWYDGANRIASESAKKYNIPIEGASGIYASLSPQMDWYKNVSLGNRVLDIMHNQSGTTFTPEMGARARQLIDNPNGGFNPATAKVVDFISGKRLQDLTDPGEKAVWLRLFDEAHNPREYNVVNPYGDIMGLSLTNKGVPAEAGWGSLREIAKAISIYEDPSIANISKRLGKEHKVRSFYNNIVDPYTGESVTSDTHNVAASLLQPLSGSSAEVLDNLGAASSSALTGTSGTYGVYADAVRNAAQERGMIPRQMQSITWEGVRGLYSPVMKRNAGSKDMVSRELQQFRSGKINMNQLRENLLSIGGGIDVPTWYGK